MIETVGPKADRLLAEKRLAEALNSSTSGETQKNDENLFDSSLYIDFLCNQQNQFSNRLRFLTMNLIETRKVITSLLLCYLLFFIIYLAGKTFIF